MTVERLSPSHHASVDELLHVDPIQNLFLIGFLDSSSLARGLWYGVTQQKRVLGVSLVLQGRLAAPWCPNSEHAAELGRHLKRRTAPSMMVGPRAACDAMWAEWGEGVEPECYYDQRLYVCHAPPEGPPVAGFRPATTNDWAVVARYSGLMEEEDLGRNPATEMPEIHEQVVRDRIRAGKTWVIERDGEIVFQINVGTAIPLGCQVGGTYVPPAHRGRGIATEGMRELCRRLLPRHAVVTLHVNEANLPAVRVYEKAGFERNAPFRLITVRD